MRKTFLYYFVYRIPAKNNNKHDPTKYEVPSLNVLRGARYM